MKILIIGTRLCDAYRNSNGIQAARDEVGEDEKNDDA
jgi:hypothetical protein